MTAGSNAKRRQRRRVPDRSGGRLEEFGVPVGLVSSDAGESRNA